MDEKDFIYEDPIVDNLNSRPGEDVITPKSVQWVWETNYVALVEYGIAGVFVALLYVLVSQIDLTP